MQDRRTTGILGAIFLAPALFAPPSLRSATDTCSASYLTTAVKGEEVLGTQASKHQAITVFGFEFDGGCHIVAMSPWVGETAVKLKSDPRRLILVNIVNEIRGGPGPCRDLTPGQMIHRLLSDPALRAEHIREIVAASALAQGIEIDYEAILRETRPHMTDFMRELRAALPPEKRLAQVLQASDQGKSIDWRGVEPYVDWIRVMAYYYSFKGSDPGPVVSYGKLGEVADFVLKNPTQSISRAKARIVLSLYGWDWPVSPRGPGKLIRYEDAVALAQTHRAAVHRDPKEDTLIFRYPGSDGAVHEVRFDDFTGHSKRVQLLLDKDFPAVDFWHLNTGDPKLWTWFQGKIRSDCPSLAAVPSPPATAFVTGFAAPAVKAGSADAQVILVGSGFTGSDAVLWRGTPLLPLAAGGDAIQFVVPAAELTKPQVAQVAVAQAGRLTNSVPFYVVGNPVMTSFNPPEAAVGTAFTLSVRGSGFEPTSEVVWQGQSIPTRFVSDQELMADVDAGLAFEEGSKEVGVHNPTSAARISRSFPIVPPDTIGSVRAGPNPWSSEKNAGGIRFFGVPAGGEVKIYTVSGTLVKSVGSGGGVMEWDLTDDGGTGVASGLYYYTTVRQDGTRHRGVLAVIR